MQQYILNQGTSNPGVACFKGNTNQKLPVVNWLADLPAIARMQLQEAGLPAAQISDCGLCSFADSRFFSHRRNGAQAGRMATFIAPRL